MPKQKILVCSGPKATITKSPPLVTSNKARSDRDESDRFDVLVPQKLKEPVDVKIKKYSAHPMEKDATEIYQESEQNHYETTLKPEDGLYLLPYLAKRDNGDPFNPEDIDDPEIDFGGRQFFYPDASRIFEEIDRTIYGRDHSGEGNVLQRKAEYEFIRPLPPAGYTKEGEVRGEDFFPYKPVSKAKGPRLRDIATAANTLQEAINKGDYDGVIWLEGSPRLEETLYWLNLVIDTELPLVGTVANRPHGEVSNDGDRNIIDAVDYIISGKGERLGAVAIQDQLIYAAREFKKSDARPGGFKSVGGQGGVLGSVKSEVHIQYVPNYKHTFKSEVSLSLIPESVSFLDRCQDKEKSIIKIKGSDGLRGEVVPRVSIIKQSAYDQVNNNGDPDNALGIMTRVKQTREERRDETEEAPELHGLVFEGTSSYGKGTRSDMSALRVAACSGIPVVRVGRSDPGGFVLPDYSGETLTIDGGNLDSNKARILLMAAILKLGRLPRAEDPRNPTTDEEKLILEKIADFQNVFREH